MSGYDRRYWSGRVDDMPIEVTQDQVDRMIEENPSLTEDQIRDVVEALNWDALSDPVGMVRVHPSGRVLAVRVPSHDQPWETIWLNGRGGSVIPIEIRKWPEYKPMEGTGE